jgi:hypothetical protein
VALIDNIAACDHLGEIRGSDVLAAREGLVATKTFACAQVADYVGEVDRAIELFRWFLDHAGSDPRVGEAEAGLARNLIARARAGDNSVIERPERTGGSGGGHAQLVFSNDTRYEQQIVVTGPETRMVTVEASATSEAYAERPGGCRTDVPSVTIDLAPGTYEIMIFDDVARPDVGTWDLGAGARYGWCAFYVLA